MVAFFYTPKGDSRMNKKIYIFIAILATLSIGQFFFIISLNSKIKNLSSIVYDLEYEVSELKSQISNMEDDLSNIRKDSYSPSAQMQRMLREQQFRQSYNR